MVGETNLARTEGAGAVIAGRLAWLKAGQTQKLLRFLVAIGLIAGVACLYFWQANAIDDIRDNTDKLTERAQKLERENAAVMVQLAQWDRPDAVAAKAAGLGLAPASGTAYAQIALPDASSSGETRPNDVASWWQQLVQEVNRRWSGVTRTANLATASR